MFFCSQVYLPHMQPGRVKDISRQVCSGCGLCQVQLCYSICFAGFLTSQGAGSPVAPHWSCLHVAWVI